MHNSVLEQQLHLHLPGHIKSHIVSSILEQLVVFILYASLNIGYFPTHTLVCEPDWGSSQQFIQLVEGKS